MRGGALIFSPTLAFSLQSWKNWSWLIGSSFGTVHQYPDPDSRSKIPLSTKFLVPVLVLLNERHVTISVERIRQSNPPSGRGVFLMYCRSNDWSRNSKPVDCGGANFVISIIWHWAHFSVKFGPVFLLEARIGAAYDLSTGRHRRPLVRNGLCAQVTLCQAAQVQACSRISRTARWRAIPISKARSLVH